MRCACGHESRNFLTWLCHVFTLGCYDENLIWKGDKAKK